MTPKECTKLENNFEFKKSYLNKTLWWLNISLAGPIILLFGGLTGVLYLFNDGRLASLYAIPYVIIFAVGTVWFKTMRVYLQKKIVKTEGTYLVCIAQPIGELNGYTYNIFVTAKNRRHERRYVEKLARELTDVDAIIKEYAKTVRTNPILLHNDAMDVDYYLKAYPTKDISRRNSQWQVDNFFPVLYMDSKRIPIVKRKHILEYAM